MLLQDVLTKRESDLVMAILDEMNTKTRIVESLRYMQHGSTSVYEHSVNVACISLKLAVTLENALHVHVDEYSLVRGALLHDYFLYDWHVSESWHRWHGFRHPLFALLNARKVYCLTFAETDIIAHHMFPLTLVPPKTLEGFLVCTADKLCALYETFRMNEWHAPIFQRRWMLQLQPVYAKTSRR